MCQILYSSLFEKQVLFYINCQNKCKQFNAQVEGDALLVVMYYLLHRCALENPLGHLSQANGTPSCRWPHPENF